VGSGAEYSECGKKQAHTKDDTSFIVRFVILSSGCRSVGCLDYILREVFMFETMIGKLVQVRMQDKVASNTFEFIGCDDNGVLFFNDWTSNETRGIRGVKEISCPNSSSVLGGAGFSKDWLRD